MRMYCIFSKDSLEKMKGIRGKMTSQSGHAFLHAFWNSELNFPEHAEEYRDSEHAVKITCVVDTDDELWSLHARYKGVCGATSVVDSGFTVFDEPTLTCIGIGPIPDELIGENLRSLRLLK